MSALLRRRTAATTTASPRIRDLWHDAVSIRTEWLAHGLRAEPADRTVAENALTGIYARIARPRPRFEWVESPAKALPLVHELPTLDDLYRWVRDPRPQGTPPLASDLVASVSSLRSTLHQGVEHPPPESARRGRNRNKGPWPDLPPPEALDAGVPLGVVLHRGVRNALHRSLVTGVALPVRSALAGAGRWPVCWYGQQDASWVAHYDVLALLGLAQYGRAESRALEDWSTVARSCGWWWPGDEVCVVVERPEDVRTEPVPGAWHDEVRLRPGGVRYRDGWRPG